MIDDNRTYPAQLLSIRAWRDHRGATGLLSETPAWQFVQSFTEIRLAGEQNDRRTLSSATDSIIHA